MLLWKLMGWKMNKLKFFTKKPDNFSILTIVNYKLVNVFSDEKYGPDDVFFPIELFENWRIKRNKVFLDWNVDEKVYYEKQNVYKFIVFMLSRWYSDDMLKNWCKFFWKTTILKAVEKYKYKFTKEFVDSLKLKIYKV